MNAGASAPAGFLLLDYVMLVPERRNLRKMCYTQNLIIFRKRLQLLAHRFRRTPANAGIDFIKYQSLLDAPLLTFGARSGDFLARATFHASLQCEHHARQL